MKFGICKVKICNIFKYTAIQCSHGIYLKLSHSVFVNKKEKEEIVFNIEIEKDFAKYDDWKRLEKWQIGRARFP